jgi:hypothetical protein
MIRYPAERGGDRESRHSACQRTVCLQPQISPTELDVLGGLLITALHWGLRAESAIGASPPMLNVAFCDYSCSLLTRTLPTVLVANR